MKGDGGNYLSLTAVCFEVEILLLPQEVVVYKNISVVNRLSNCMRFLLLTLNSGYRNKVSEGQSFCIRFVNVGFLSQQMGTQPIEC